MKKLPEFPLPFGESNGEGMYFVDSVSSFPDGYLAKAKRTGRLLGDVSEDKVIVSYDCRRPGAKRFEWGGLGIVVTREQARYMDHRIEQLLDSIDAMRAARAEDAERRGDHWKTMDSELSHYIGYGGEVRLVPIKPGGSLEWGNWRGTYGDEVVASTNDRMSARRAVENRYWMDRGLWPAR